MKDKRIIASYKTMKTAQKLLENYSKGYDYIIDRLEARETADRIRLWLKYKAK